MSEIVVRVEQRVGDVLVEVEGREDALIAAPAAAVIVVERMGISGPAGPEGPPADDPGDLTLLFDNHLI